MTPDEYRRYRTRRQAARRAERLAGRGFLRPPVRERVYDPEDYAHPLADVVVGP